MQVSQLAQAEKVDVRVEPSVLPLQDLGSDNGELDTKDDFVLHEIPLALELDIALCGLAVGFNPDQERHVKGLVVADLDVPSRYAEDVVVVKDPCVRIQKRAPVNRDGRILFINGLEDPGAGHFSTAARRGRAIRAAGGNTQENGGGNRQSRQARPTEEWC